MVRIPYRRMLNIMLQKLGIPEAEYRLEAREEGKLKIALKHARKAGFVSLCLSTIMNQPFQDHLWTRQYLESYPQIMTLLKNPLLCEQLSMFRMPPIWGSEISITRLKQLEEQNKSMKQQLRESDYNGTAVSDAWKHSKGKAYTKLSPTNNCAIK